MISFFKEFTNRELAIFIWIGLFIVAMLFIKDVRNSVARLFRSLLSRKLQMIFIPLCVYSFLIVYLLRVFKFWDYSLLKDTIFWFFGVAFSQIFRITNGVSMSFFKKIIIDSIKITIILEFILNTYAFNLPIELVLVLGLIILSALKPLAERKKDYKDVNSCITNGLAIAGLIMIIFSLYQTIVHYKDFFSVSSLKSILLSPILTFLYIPFLYLLAVYMTYEVFFVNLSFQTARNKELLKSLKWEIIKVAGLNITKLNNISSNISKREIQTIGNKREYLRMISKSK